MLLTVKHTWRAALRVWWMVPVILLPPFAAMALHLLNDYAQTRRDAAGALQTLSADANETAADAAWVIVLRNPPGSWVPEFDTDYQRVERDLTGLATSAIPDAQLAEVERAVTRSITALESAARTADTGGASADETARAAVASADAEHDSMNDVIRVATANLVAMAGAAELLREVAIWVAVLGSSVGAIVLIWRADSRGRTIAIARSRQAALADSELMYRVLFDDNPAPMWTYESTSLRFVRVNKAAVRAYGYSEEEFLQMTLLDIRPPGDVEAFLSRPAHGHDGPTVCSVRHRCKDGSVIDVEVTADDVEIGGRDVTLVLARDVTEQHRLGAELRDRAVHDALTGLPNREMLLDRFRAGAERAARERHGLGLVMIDLDGFKAVNDTFGHTVGDMVLCQTARRFSEKVRPAETIARLGGDEFAVLVEGAGRRRMERLARRLLDTLATPFDVDGTAVQISASAGVAPVEPGATLDRAMQHADVALYESKARGKGRLEIYTPQMKTAVLERLEIAAGFERALSMGEMAVHYQPIVSLKSDSDEREVEALIRWMHPTRGAVSPADFIPIAEQTGAIIRIGTWVLRQACEQAAEWQRSGQRVTVAINVSGRQLRDSDFVAEVERVLVATGLDPARLVLEVTETAMLEDLSAAKCALGRARAMGVRVALDDFGAGYSSLNYLVELPVDMVKIDRALVAASAVPDRRAVLVTITRLLRNMGLRTVVEGVETADQLRRMADLGVDACQGFLFSPAVPPGDVRLALASCDIRLADHGGEAAAA